MVSALRSSQCKNCNQYEPQQIQRLRSEIYKRNSKKLTLLRGKENWLVVDWPTTRQDFPVDLTHARLRDQLPADPFALDPRPLVVASCDKRKDARAIVKMGRRDEILFYGV